MELKVAAVRDRLLFHMCKSPALLRQSRATGMQGVDQCINGLMAHLIYKAGDKAMRKQSSTGRDFRRETYRENEREKVLLD